MDKPSTTFLTILGSSRSNGNTKLVGDHFYSEAGGKLIDLNDHDVSYYDYDHHNRDDDFLDIIRDFVENYDTLVLITPIYWYTMSAQIKNFLDRTSDLITIEKDLGRKLRGKSMLLISQTEGDSFASWFAEPFRMTAEYLGMDYKGHVHLSIENEGISEPTKKRLENLLQTLV